MNEKLKKERGKGMNLKNEEQNLKVSQNRLKQTKGITLIALVITIVLNCSFLAMA